MRAAGFKALASDAGFTVADCVFEVALRARGEGLGAATGVCRTGAVVLAETFDGAALGAYLRSPEKSTKAKIAESPAIAIDVQSRESRCGICGLAALQRASKA